MMMNIKTEDALSGYSRLLCPSCGNTTLHHGKVEIFAKKHVTVDVNGWVDTNNDMTGNPSQDRDGILIHLWCECCPNKSVMAISQHKGETQLSVGIVHESITY